MRARIDISELESETKIRAKYLRALENEEWDLLPGPTYVKSFLRTYAEALGLDGRLLVEEFKLRYERLSESELQPISPRSRAQRDRRRQRKAPGAGRDIAVAVVVLLIVGGLIALGRVGNDNGDGSTTPAQSTQTSARPSQTGTHRATPKHKKKVRRNVTLTLVATAPVYVCLRAGDKVLVPAQTLPAGKKAGPFKAKRFAMTFGNNNVRMRVNGKQRDVPASSGAIGYVVDRKGRRNLPAGKLPTCGA